MYATSTEESEAQKNFNENLRKHEMHNKKPNVTYTQGETSDSDKSYEWKKKHRMGLKKPKNPSNASSVLPKMLSTRVAAEIPDSADWSSYCSPIKDQSMFYVYIFDDFKKYFLGDCG